MLERIVWKQFAGVRVRGVATMPVLAAQAGHLEAAAWLTAQVESGGKFGTVISFDGTGLTAGLHQAVAVYPRAAQDADATNDQGPLWALLALLRAAWGRVTPRDLEPRWDQWEADFTAEGLRMTATAGVIDEATGQLATGERLRQVFTGDAEGCMPVEGFGRERAERWAARTSALMSAPWTWPTQLAFGEQAFVVGARQRVRIPNDLDRVGRRVSDVCYGGQSVLALRRSELPPALDLAMAVYWSHSVNAPAVALRALGSVAQRFAAGDADAPRALIAQLGNTQWGRWDDDIPNGRYQRTRAAAQRIWPADLFAGPHAVMPADLPW